MANKAAKQVSTYSITGTLNIQVSLEIQADSFDAAVAHAKALKESDFVDFTGEYVDGSMEITSIYKY